MAKWAHGEMPAVDPMRMGLARADRGWAAGMHPTDAFLKNTHEILGPLHLATAQQRLTRFEFLAPDGSIRHAVYGEGNDATHVTVNFGSSEATVNTRLATDVLLPRWGFVVESPRAAAFYAKRWSGRNYRDGAMFTFAAVDGKNLGQANKVRVFHGFGDPTFVWKGRTHEVAREETVVLDQK
jgi:hypothetical protein